MQTEVLTKVNRGGGRSSNIELCRIFSILMVVVLHSNYGWNGWPNGISCSTFPLLLVESFAIVGVNVFVFISGWFSASLKVKSVVNLLYICFFYAVLKLIVGWCTGNFNPKDVLFISRSNWFIPAYIGMLLLTPFLNKITEVSKNHLGKLILSLLIFDVWFGYLPRQAAIEPGFYFGYSTLSFSIIYLVARYFRVCGVPSWLRKFAPLIYVFCTLLIATEGYALIYLLTGKSSDVGSSLNHFVFAYNNPLILLSSFAFFFMFEKIKMKNSRVINYLAQSVLAVLLIHGSGATNFWMKDIIHYIMANYNGAVLALLWFLEIVLIFLACVIVDQLRIFSYKAIGPRIVNKIKNRFNAAVQQ